MLSKFVFHKNYLNEGGLLDDAFYNDLKENQKLLSDAQKNELGDKLAKPCEQEYNKNNYENVTRYYLLHLLLTSSPATAMKLASMAQEGKYIKPNALGRLQGIEISLRDYPKAAHYYDMAIQNAFEQFDFEAANAAIEQYLKVERNFPKEHRLDISAKIQRHLAAFSFSCLEKVDDSLSDRAKFLLSRTKNLKAARYPNRNFTDVAALEFFNLLMKQPLALENISKLCNVYLGVCTKGQSAWFIMVANKLEWREGADPNIKKIGNSLIALLPLIIVNLIEKTPIDLDEIQKLLNAILIAGLHLRELKSVAAFLERVSKRLAHCLVGAAISVNVEDLGKITQILRVCKILNQHNVNYIDHSEVCAYYWFERSVLEKSPDNQASNSELKQIYLWAHYEKNGVQRTFSMVAKSYFEQLKAKNHPEALLKLAQLHILELNSNTPDIILKEIGTNLIKAAGCLIPQDKFGIYKALCFNMLSKLKEKVDNEKVDGNPAFTNKQRGIIHFYYALSLFIFDKKRFDDEHTTFFKERNYKVTVPSILVLFKDSKYEFTDAVRHYLLTMIVGIDNMLEPGLVKEANLLLKQTPPDASIKSDCERDNATLKQEAQGCLDQIAKMSALLEEKNRQLALLDRQVAEATPALNLGH